MPRWPYLVMELVDGASLDQSRREYGKVEWAVPILRDVASALRTLHAAGTIHRDLKPGNVLPTHDVGGRLVAKVSDFGISRIADPLDRISALEMADTMNAQRAADRSPLTETGVLLGTPNYMAPELARGARHATTAVDVFAFGVLAFEVLTGSSPFARPPVFLALAGAPLPKPAIEIRGTAGVPPNVVDAIEKCIAEDPRDRPSADALAAAFASA